MRCHDDIGWTFDDGDASALGINGYDHRRFLNSFYTGRFPGSFARAALPGEPAHRRRAHLRHVGVAGRAGGRAARRQSAARSSWPCGASAAERHRPQHRRHPAHLPGRRDRHALNDYSYVDDPAKAGDSRWVHRPRTDWAQMARHDPATLEGRIFGGLQHLIQLRKATPAFAGNDMRVINVGNDHVFAFVRTGRQGERVLVLANFSEHTQPVAANEVRLYGLGYRFHEVITQQEMTLSDAPIVLEPYQVMWLAA
jgi:amylosucrase